MLSVIIYLTVTVANSIINRSNHVVTLKAVILLELNNHTYFVLYINLTFVERDISFFDQARNM